MVKIPRHAQVVFCDDIRLEIGNKASLMGVYGGEMVFPAFPGHTPQLCVSVQIRTPVSEPIEVFSIRIVHNDLTIVDFSPTSQPSFNDSAQSIWFASSESTVEELKFIVAAFHFPGFMAEKEGDVKVFVSADGTQLAAQALRIRAQLPEPVFEE